MSREVFLNELQVGDHRAHKHDRNSGFVQRVKNITSYMLDATSSIESPVEQYQSELSACRARATLGYLLTITGTREQIQGVTQRPRDFTRAMIAIVDKAHRP
jgi:hypothetical protein